MILVKKMNRGETIVVCAHQRAARPSFHSLIIAERGECVKECAKVANNIIKKREGNNDNAAVGGS